MDLQPKSYEKVRRLLDKGVDIRNPGTLDIGDEVNIHQISSREVKIYPGCRIYGQDTVISAGCSIGAEAPATIENCRLGSRVQLKGGYFRESVFLDDVSLGSGAHIREGCILEEEASGAHSVGLKQTILFPFVTLGSLINFCDCLMAGGTSRKHHSEVGSSYIHFNFTPDGDKATPSLIGDVPRGVLLNQPPIFLGGQGGLVGPLRIGYGNVVAAGSILREDYPQDHQLIFAEAPDSRMRKFLPGLYPDFLRVVKKNIFYLANLKALEAWYVNVRKPFLESSEFGTSLHRGALDQLSRAVIERLARLKSMAEKAAASTSRKRGDKKQTFLDHFENIEAIVHALPEDKTIQKTRDVFFRTFAVHCKNATGSYLDVIGKLPPEAAAKGVCWLQSIVDYYCQRASSVLSSRR